MKSQEREGRETIDKEEQSNTNTIFELVKSILTILVLAFLIRTFVFNATLVDGSSMNPTLQNKDRLITLRYPLYFTEPSRGEIVIIKAPNGSGDNYIKRVIGVPGDVIDIIEGRVYLNDELIEEEYISPSEETLTNGPYHWELEEREFFLLGDNRAPGQSVDSRMFGPIDFKEIKGIAKLRYWPLEDIMILK